MSYKYVSTRRRKCREYYYRTKTACRSYAKAHHEARRQIVNEKKRQPCADCNGWFDPCQMQFDHRDSKTKSFAVGNSGSRSLRMIFNEISKCDVLCANCHALRTYRRAHANKTSVAWSAPGHVIQTYSRADETGMHVPQPLSNVY